MKYHELQKLLHKRTNGGYIVVDCMNAIQKCLRRNKPKTCIFFFMELIDTDKLVGLRMIKLMEEMLYTDIGVADSLSFMHIKICLTDVRERLLKGRYKAVDGSFRWRENWLPPMVTAIYLFCRAKKVKLSEYMSKIAPIYRYAGWKPEIPDFCYNDKTTRRGRMRRISSDQHIAEVDCLHNEVKSKTVNEIRQFMGRVLDFQDAHKIPVTGYPICSDDELMAKVMLGEDWKSIKNFHSEETEKEDDES